MKAAELTDTGTVEVVERDRPTPEADQVVVRVGACGVCMTDYHMYSGSLTVDLPMTPGHESAGEVVAVGAETDRYEPGDRVAMNPTVSCGACPACKGGHENLCESLTSIGGAADTILDGAFAEYVSVPASNLEPIGEMAYEEAAFAEPLGCCIHGVDRIDLTSGETVAVVGAGPIGLLLVQYLRSIGAGEIVVSELVEERREAALELGADYVVNPEEEDPREAVADLVGEVDVAIEAVGLPKTIEQAHALIGKGGRTLVFGVPPEDATVELSPFEVFYHEESVIGTFALTPDTFARAVTMLRTGRVNATPLITDEFELEGLSEAFAQMDERRGLKKMIYPGGR